MQDKNLTPPSRPQSALASTCWSRTTGGLSLSTAEQRRDLLEIVEDRYQAGSLIITTQVPVERSYEIAGDPALADAILDRLVHTTFNRSVFDGIGPEYLPPVVERQLENPLLRHISPSPRRPQPGAKRTGPAHP
jgi:IstB-like ATP binding protein